MALNSLSRQITQRALGAVSLTLLAAAVSPIFIPYAALTKLQGKDVFFTQIRYGRNKAPFQIWKLRTLDEGKVTKIGHWLRKTSIDELPQLLNIARGEMDFIGPRPLMIQPDDYTKALTDANHRQALSHHEKRYRVNPGMSGLSQISSFRSIADHSIEDLANIFHKDDKYVAWREKGQLPSFFIDAAIGIITIPSLFVHRGATQRQDAACISYNK